MSQAPDAFRGRRKVAEILREDEALLQQGAPAFRVAVIGDRALSIGVAQPEDAPAALRAKELGFPVAHRSSGGTGMLHLPGDIAWTVVLSRSDPTAGRDYTRAYPRLGAALPVLLAAVGVTAGWRPSPGLSEELCLLGSRGDALFAGPVVIGGAAQHLTRSALLHHGVLNLRIDRPLLGTLFHLEPSVTRSVGCLRELGVALAAEEIGIRLALALPRSLPPG
jgi:lipoate-protein ligase A